jgi:hypothetical protein
MMILAEQAHDARIVPIFASAEKARASHKPSAIQPWLGRHGRLVGRRHVRDGICQPQTDAGGEPGIVPAVANGVVTERFTRTATRTSSTNSPSTIRRNYTQPWKVELAFYPSPGVYEYACHEGNYGMHGILAGAREKERQAAGLKGKDDESQGRTVGAASAVFRTWTLELIKNERSVMTARRPQEDKL